MKAYRVVRDVPIGVAVGFKPEGEWTDEYELVSDSGGEFVFIYGSRMGIKDSSAIQAEPDLHVWRSPEEFAEWKQDMGGSR